MILTGIGSRETPQNILNLMTQIGQKFARAGWTLRSGGANGADSAFEKGFKEAGGKIEIYLPWKKFNNNFSTNYDPPSIAFTLAEQLHPAWSVCSQGAKRLHARNCQQILGQNLDSPTNLVICWTKAGGLTGGTATAIKLAKQYGIRVINLFETNWTSDLEEELLNIGQIEPDTGIGISYDENERSDEDPNGLEIDELREW